MAQQYVCVLRFGLLRILNTGSPQTLERMRKAGLAAYTVQMGPYFEGLAIRDANPPGATDNSPPVRHNALDKGACRSWRTDSTRIGIAGVWHAIRISYHRYSVGGSVRKPASERLTRLEALALYTRHAARSPFAEHRQRLASKHDLAVLNQPFMTMPEDDRIDTTRAVLTLVDGRINLHESPTQRRTMSVVSVDAKPAFITHQRR